MSDETVREQWSMECPKCHSDEGINITCDMRVDVLLVQDGTVEDEGSTTGHEWEDDSAAWCSECQFEGTVKDFQLDKEVEA